jgi:hypothetical protein
MQWLKSYLPVVEGPHTDLKTAHCHPNARAKFNDNPARELNRLSHKSDGPPIQYESKLYRAWAITNTGKMKGVHPIQNVLLS